MYILPFTYSWIIKKNIAKHKIKTILELGCGQGFFADLINDENQFKITGVDIFEPYIRICKKKGKYERVIKGNLTNKLPFKNKSFDSIVCLQTIEHLNKKDGLFLLSEIDRVAKKVILLSIPNGECVQEVYDDNNYQRHLSQWEPDELIKNGYTIYGTGLKWVYKKHSHMGDRIKLQKLLLYFLSFLMNPISYINPNISAQLVAVKVK